MAPLIAAPLVADAEGFSPLHCAVLRRSPPTLSELLRTTHHHTAAAAANANTNTVNANTVNANTVNANTGNANTAAVAADASGVSSRGGCSDEVGRPLFDVDATNRYLQTPLHLAVARSFQSAGVASNGGNGGSGGSDAGNDPITTSSDGGGSGSSGGSGHERSLRLVELLLRAGADVNARDDCGATPLDLANQHAASTSASACAGLVECLERWGGLPAPKDGGGNAHRRSGGRRSNKKASQQKRGAAAAGKGGGSKQRNNNAGGRTRNN